MTLTGTAPWPADTGTRTDPQEICDAECALVLTVCGPLTFHEPVSCVLNPAEPASESESETKTEIIRDSGPPQTRTPVEFGYVNPLGTVDLNVVLGRIIRTVLGFVGALFLAMFVYGGTQWMVAGGDAKKVESGRKTLINAVIGMVVIAISYSIISIIFETASVIRGG